MSISDGIKFGRNLGASLTALDYGYGTRIIHVISDNDDMVVVINTDDET